VILVLSQPLPEMSIRNPPGGKGLPVLKADKLITIYETIVYSLDVSKNYGSSRPVTGIALPLSLPRALEEDTSCSCESRKSVTGIINYLLWAQS
jgi:hypothetical protein